MGLHTIEAIIRRLIDDAEFRATAVADPAAVLADFPLAAVERRALTGLLRRLADGRPLAADISLMGWWWWDAGCVDRPWPLLEGGARHGAIGA